VQDSRGGVGGEDAGAGRWESEDRAECHAEDTREGKTVDLHCRTPQQRCNRV
jgi:hypothetical protein